MPLKALTPNYANIKMPYISPAHRQTQQKITSVRIKDEIRYLYSKKQELNQQIYQLHLALTHTWDNTWLYIYNTNEKKIGI